MSGRHSNRLPRWDTVGQARFMGGAGKGQLAMFIEIGFLIPVTATPTDVQQLCCSALTVYCKRSG